MKIFFLAFSIFFLLNSASAGIELSFGKVKVRQGSIVKAEAILGADVSKEIKLNELEGKTIQDTLYVQSVENVNGKIFFIVIFAKVPERASLPLKLGPLETSLSWKNLTVEPIDIPKSFLLGDFSVSGPLQVTNWVLGLLLILFLFLAGKRIYKKVQYKSELRKRKLELWEKMVSAKNYDEVVSLWQLKHIFLREFSSVEEPFKLLEKVLFEYQFKPSQTSEEKEVVMNAYRLFLDRTRGGKDGI